MATETQKSNDRESQKEQLHKETLETVEEQKPSLAERLEESPNTSTQPSNKRPSSTEDLVTDPPPKEGEESKESESPGTEAHSGSSIVEPVSDLQKKMRRAERFGMPVQLSEEEKRNSRAERFGTQSTLIGSDELKKSEELKRKARAERFGLSAQSTSDEEMKKKARLARFAQASKIDTVEEDKKKARALRFSQTASVAPSQVNGKGNTEQKMAIVAEATGGA